MSFGYDEDLAGGEYVWRFRRTGRYPGPDRPLAHPDISDVTIEVDPPAERLRFKGARLHYTHNGETWDYRVASVSMPDELGRCVLTVEPA